MFPMTGRICRKIGRLRHKKTPSPSGLRHWRRAGLPHFGVPGFCDCNELWSCSRCPRPTALSHLLISLLAASYLLLVPAHRL